MQELSTVLTSLSVASGLALGVERTLEVLKHIMELENSFTHAVDRDISLKRAENAIANANQAVAELNQAGDEPGADTEDNPEGEDVQEDAESAQEELSSADRESDERFPAPPIPVLPATPQSTIDTSKTLFLQLAAAGFGMILAQIFDLHLMSIFLQGYGITTSSTFGLIDVVFTGLVIGGGSQPIHVLIRFLTEHKVTLEDAIIAKREEASAATPKIAPAPPEQEAEHAWRPIDYRGGVHPERLENTHRRPGEPNLVVYHHTAMASSAPFQDVVNEFLVNKKWVTGYNCVIMPDGAVRPFCRWDRFGNHTKGKNARSLGIAFHGNFHTLTDDQYSNADGRYGNKQPTQAQLHAGARVIALWIYLYDDIRLDFEGSILAHKEALPSHTVCPGSNFPHKAFQQLIRQYYEAWAESQLAQKGIEAFKKLDYVYAFKRP